MNSLTQSRKKSNSGPNTNWIKLYLTGFDVTRLGDVFRMGDVQKINFIYSNPEVVDWIYVGRVCVLYGKLIIGVCVLNE